MLTDMRCGRVTLLLPCYIPTICDINIEVHANPFRPAALLHCSKLPFGEFTRMQDLGQIKRDLARDRSTRSANAGVLEQSAGKGHFAENGHARMRTSLIDHYNVLQHKAIRVNHFHCTDNLCGESNEFWKVGQRYATGQDVNVLPRIQLLWINLRHRSFRFSKNASMFFETSRRVGGDSSCFTCDSSGCTSEQPAKHVDIMAMNDRLVRLRHMLRSLNES